MHMFISGKPAIAGSSAVEVFKLPAFAAIGTALLHVNKGQTLVSRMATLDQSVIAEREADNQLVVPMPHPIIGGLTGKSARLAVYDDLSHKLSLQMAHHLADLAEMIGAMYDDAQH